MSDAGAGSPMPTVVASGWTSKVTRIVSAGASATSVVNSAPHSPAVGKSTFAT